MIKSMIGKIENTRITFAQWIMGFLGVLFVRIFLENFSSVPATGNWTSDASTIIHYYLYYLAVTISLLLFIGIFIDRSKLERIALFALAGNVAAPLLDLFISGGKGYLMHYIFADGPGLMRSFFLFFTPAAVSGITPGMKIEFALGLSAFFAYVAYSTKSAVKGACAAIGAYAIMFFWGSLPSVWKLVCDFFSPSGAVSPEQFFLSSEANSVIVRNFFHPTVQISYLRAAEVFFSVAISEIYYILIFILAAAYFFVRYPEKFSAVLDNSRQLRAAHYYVMIGIGILVGIRITSPSISWNWLDVVSLTTLLTAFFSARAYAGGVNDVEDMETDKISNSRRPLPSGRLSAEDIGNVNLFFLAWALLGGFLAGQYALFAVVAALFASYIYSVPPLRLKNYPLIATFLIAVASCAAFAAGFYFVSPDKSTHALPIQYLLLIILGLTLGENVKDVKDIEGDRVAGAYTIPVLFGDKAGKRIVGAMLAAAFLFVPLILRSQALLAPSLIAAFFGYIFANQRSYKEWKVLSVCAVYALAAVSIFLLHG